MGSAAKAGVRGIVAAAISPDIADLMNDRIGVAVNRVAAAIHGATAASEEARKQARRNPRWHPDGEHGLCQLCGVTEFWRIGSAAQKRHHCRCCGWVVCLDCLPVGQTLELGTWISSSKGHPRRVDVAERKQKRVCNSCFEAVQRENRLRTQARSQLEAGQAAAGSRDFRRAITLLEGAQALNVDDDAELVQSLRAALDAAREANARVEYDSKKSTYAAAKFTVEQKGIKSQPKDIKLGLNESGIHVFSRTGMPLATIPFDRIPASSWRVEVTSKKAGTCSVMVKTCKVGKGSGVKLNDELVFQTNNRHDADEICQDMTKHYRQWCNPQ